MLAAPAVDKIHGILKNTVGGWLLSLDFSGRGQSEEAADSVLDWQAVRIQGHFRRSDVGGKSLNTE